MDIHSIKRSLLIACSLLALTSCYSSETIEDEYIGKYDVPPLIQALGVPFTMCPDRVWASTEQNFKQSGVLVIDRPRGVTGAFHWQAVDNSVSNVELDLLDHKWFSIYHFGHYQGNKTLGVNALEINNNQRSDGSTYWKHDVFLLLHESFHYFGQENWQIDYHERVGNYPLQWQPRYLRTKLIHALQEALTNKSDLSEAKYWHNSYLQEYPEEAQVTEVFDVIEGTAEYAGYVMLALAEYGCDISEPQLIKNINDNIPEFNYTLTSNLESYRLGLLSGLLLRERHQGHEHWQSQAESGVSLVDVLLKDVTEQPTNDDTAFIDKLKEEVSAQNDFLSDKLSPAISAFKNQQYYRLSLSDEALNTFKTTGFYIANNDPDINRVMTDFSGILELSNGKILEVNEFQMLEVDSTPCGDKQLVMPLAMAEIRFDTLNHITHRSSVLIFENVQANKVVANGYEWLCIN